MISPLLQVCHSLWPFIFGVCGEAIFILWEKTGGINKNITTQGIWIIICNSTEVPVTAYFLLKASNNFIAKAIMNNEGQQN